ncbi:MAG: aminodeoxychorismate synthase component I [Pseudomonadota bacterium]
MNILRFRPASHDTFRPDSLLEPGAVLLESQRPDRENKRSYLLRRPCQVLACHHAREVEGCLRDAQQVLSRGMALAGFLTYEAGLALQPEAGLAPKPLEGFPLVWLAAYERVEACEQPLDLPPGKESAGHHPERDPKNFDVSDAGYERLVRRAQAYIAAGDNYQTNLTCRLRSQSDEEPLAAYLRLRRAHPVPYGAYLNCGDFQVVSQSPELFLRRRGTVMLSRPMKGTSRRGLGNDQDEALARGLRGEIKCRAENVMIADLMRSDLGRLAQYGSVGVTGLFRVERYATVLQMTSGVRCRLSPGLSLLDILRATFPPGSVTGAPKLRTMQIIHELELSARGVYTGAIGLFLPGGDMVLSVAIRTAVNRGGRWHIGVGSGIVADSDPRAECEETKLKSRFFFTSSPGDFKLLETLPWRAPNGFGDLGAHLRRLKRSARFFGYPFAEKSALNVLRAAINSGSAAPEMRVRLLLAAQGCFEAGAEPLLPLPATRRVLLSGQAVYSHDLWRYHKTTRREQLDAALAGARRQGFLEVLFLNEEGFLTEGSFTNLMLRRGGEWKTPALSCGLLPGIWRAEFMRRHRAREARLSPADLARAEAVVIGNSLRGSIEIVSITDAEGLTIPCGGRTSALK